MKKIVILCKYILLILTMAIPVVLLGLLIYHFHNIENQIHPLAFFCSLFGVLGLSFFLTSKLLDTPLLNNVYRQLNVREQIKRRKRKLKNSAEVMDMQIDKQVYESTKKNYSQLNYLKVIFLLALIIVLFVFGLISGSIYEFNGGVFVIVAGFLGLCYNYFGRRVIISPKGIRSVSLLKDQFIKWEDVKEVGVSVLAEGHKAPDWLMLIYVSKKDLKTKHVVLGKDEKGIVTFKFRAKMVHHVMTYWDGEVKNLANVKRWRRYLLKNGVSAPNEKI